MRKHWFPIVATVAIVYLAAALREILVTLAILNDTNATRRKAMISLDERLRRVEERQP